MRVSALFLKGAGAGMESLLQSLPSHALLNLAAPCLRQFFMGSTADWKTRHLLCTFDVSCDNEREGQGVKVTLYDSIQLDLRYRTADGHGALIKAFGDCADPVIEDHERIWLCSCTPPRCWR